MLRASSGSLGPLRNINSFSWCLETGQRCSGFVSNRDLWTTRSRCKPKYLIANANPLSVMLWARQRGTRWIIKEAAWVREKLWGRKSGEFPQGFIQHWTGKTKQLKKPQTTLEKKKNKAETNLLWLFNTTFYSRDKVYIHNLHLSLASSEPSASHISAALGN